MRSKNSLTALPTKGKASSALYSIGLTSLLCTVLLSSCIGEMDYQDYFQEMSQQNLGIQFDEKRLFFPIDCEEFIIEPATVYWSSDIKKELSYKILLVDRDGHVAAKSTAILNKSQQLDFASAMQAGFPLEKFPVPPMNIQRVKYRVPVETIDIDLTIPYFLVIEVLDNGRPLSRSFQPIQALSNGEEIKVVDFNLDNRPTLISADTTDVENPSNGFCLEGYKVDLPTDYDGEGYFQIDFNSSPYPTGDSTTHYISSKGGKFIYRSSPWGLRKSLEIPQIAAKVSAPYALPGKINKLKTTFIQYRADLEKLEAPTNQNEKYVLSFVSTWQETGYQYTVSINNCTIDTLAAEVIRAPRPFELQFTPCAQRAMDDPSLPEWSVYINGFPKVER